ncbi:MAG: class I SAM-dependent methyltransferase [Bacteroidales bacterium]|nr:class I SAM-dependent methyltransferase [Bacteroidales bacterium]
MSKTLPFDQYVCKYEQWFEDHYFVFLSEIKAIQSLMPQKGHGVEIGIGSGIFATALGIPEGCDPSATMRKKALERGLKAVEGIAENLPYPNATYDYALIVTTICFVDDPMQSLREINRILKPGGQIIVGFVDKNSPIGKEYQINREKSFFYKDACFFSTEEIYKLLWGSGFEIEKTCQTIFGPLNDIKDIQQPKNGSSKGSFVVVKATKNE